MTPSRLANSCTWISPMPLLLLGVAGWTRALPRTHRADVQSKATLVGVPVLFEVANERRAEVAVRLLAAEGRHVLPKEVERLGADAQGAPVARGVHETRARQRLDAPADGVVHLL